MPPLLLHEVGHIILYLLVALVLKALVCKNLNSKLIAFGPALTLLIDLDHLFDYVLAHGFVVNLPLMLSGEYFHTTGKIFVPLHSWELVVVFLAGYLLAKLKGRVKLSQTLLVSFTALFVHLIFDIFYYGFNPLSYFVTYRALHGFSAGIF